MRRANEANRRVSPAALARVLRIGAATAVFAASAIKARQGLSDCEWKAYRAVNDAPDALAPIAWPPMQVGSLSAPFAIAALSWYKTRRLDPAVVYAGAGFVTWLTAKGVKKLVGRGRPYDLDQATNLRLGTKTDGSLGFISGHAAVAATLASIASNDRPPGSALALHATAAVVGVTRLYVGAHLPLDAIGGCAYGVIVGEVANAFRERLQA